MKTARIRAAGFGLQMARMAWRGASTQTSLIDDVRVYHYALGDTQVTELYAAGESGPGNKPPGE
jgi:hypothetical protein